MSNNYKVSVIIPMYNAEKYIEILLKSVLKQSYNDIECIVIDDGSKDNSLEILDGYKDFKEIKLISKQNEGVSITRNMGLDLATGKYILFIDSDDYISDNYIENMVDFSIRHGLDIVEPQYVFDNKIRSQSDKTYSEINILDYMETGKSGYVAGKLIKKSIIKDNSVYFDHNLQYSEDKLFLHELLVFTKNIGFNSKSQYFVNGSNSSSLSKKFVRNYSYLENRTNEVLNRLYCSIKCMDNDEINKMIAFQKIRFLYSEINNLFKQGNNYTTIERYNKVKIIYDDKADKIHYINMMKKSKMKRIYRFLFSRKNYVKIYLYFLLKNFILKFRKRKS